MSVNNHCYTSRWTVRDFENIVGEWHLTLASHVHQGSTGVLEDSAFWANIIDQTCSMGDRYFEQAD